MRIALISTPFIRVPPVGYGGTELFCYELAEELTTRGHDVTIFTTGDSEVSCRKRSLFQKPQWPPTPEDELSHAAWSLGEAARLGCDLVHLNNALGVPLTRFVRLPCVYTVHHVAVEAVSRIYAQHPDVTYVGISQRQLELETPLPRARVIHHGLSAHRYPPSLRDEGYALHIGRFCAEKGTHLAIDVARAAGVELVLAGRTHPQDQSYFDEQVAHRLPGPGLRQFGEANHDSKVRLMRGARAVLCPLRWEEPFGLVAIEAMLCGTPVVGFARGSFPEIVDEGITGFLVPDGDLDGLARTLRQLSHFDRAACARRARERFSIEVMTDAYERVYRELLAGGRRAPRPAGAAEQAA
jgi:glycosyltransferase involved in cell wall biosynthesis